MKIGIFTFHCALNYGAVLQAYGLKNYLQSLGHEVHVIDYKPQYLSRQHRLFQLDKYPNMSLLTRVKMFFRECLILPVRIKRIRKFDCFCKRHLDLDNLDLDNRYNDYDVFIFGSDQIWNRLITNGGDPVYWGDFPAAANKKLVSYAASVGSIANITSSDISRKQLSDFFALSVREKSLVDFIKENFEIHARLVLDPVFMAGVGAFDSLCVPNNKKNYLLLFLLVENENIRSIAKFIAKEKSLDVVEILSMQETLRNGVHMDVSPEQFLGYIKYASFVVTASFHGTAFSILFERQFVTVAIDKINDERSYNLLKSLGLQERYVVNEGDVNLNTIDYNSVREIYKEQQKKSRQFLKEALSCKQIPQKVEFMG